MPETKSWQQQWDESPASAVLKREPAIVGGATMDDMARRLIASLLEQQRLRLINAPEIRRIHIDNISACRHAMMDIAQDIRKQSERLGRRAEKIQLDVLKLEAQGKELK